MDAAINKTYLSRPWVEHVPPISMKTCLAKAINAHETAVEDKHIQSIFLATSEVKGGSTFWDCMSNRNLGLKENSIICWKFCYVLHQVLRDGHDQFLLDSQLHKGLVMDIGDFWANDKLINGHVNVNYGGLDKTYCNLLVAKLWFHQRNKRFRGNLTLDGDTLFQSAGEAENALFQLSVEMFDYLDIILDLQGEIFKTMDTLKRNSMTNSGQCRIKPLIPCIQDSVLLYDYVTKILFRLHAKISPDILDGHRGRHRKVFLGLQELFRRTLTLEYFKNQIEIQDVLKEPPNFMNQYELAKYQPSRLRVFRSERNMTDCESQTDTILASESKNLTPIVDTYVSSSHSPDVMALYLEKDKRVAELESELERLNLDTKRFKSSVDTQFQQLQFDHEEMHCELNEKLAEKEIKIQEAADHICIIPHEFLDRLEKAEANAKSNEDKFLKMKELYTNLRGEHIGLLRKTARVEKELSDLRKTATTNADFAAHLEYTQSLHRDTADLERQSSTELKKQTEEYYV